MIREVGKVVMVSFGRIVECDTHDELLDRGGM
jgi:ABC-type multidrug transport system fused ATPase/permease subunit